MNVVHLSIDNFRGIAHAALEFDGHTLLVGPNNIGKSTVCEALDLALGPDRLNRSPVAQEQDFFNGEYLGADALPKPAVVEVILIELSPEVLRACAANLELWHSGERRLLDSGELRVGDSPEVKPCLRLQARVVYDPEEDDFVGATYFVHPPVAADRELTKVSSKIKRLFGFLYLRALRTGSRALSLERGTLLDNILRMKSIRTGLWETTRKRLMELDPPIDGSADDLGRVLKEIEARIGQYIPLDGEVRSSRLFVSQLTREHLRKTLTFFLSMWPGQQPIPFQHVGTGTLNVLVLALLTFIGDAKPGDVIFAMEEPEIALPPHTQRRIAKYLLSHSGQCFVTSHSPYVIECFAPEQITVLERAGDASLTGRRLALPPSMKLSTYRSHLRRAIAEAILGRGVIVCEGISEQIALGVVASKLEAADDSVFPLDVAGVCIVSNDGDGNLSELGALFRTAGVTTFAFYDKKARKPEEDLRIRDAYELATESPYLGLEVLLSTECSIDRQWEFLDEVRADDPTGRFGIPGTRPVTADEIREHTARTLRGMKGTGGAARLLDKCGAAEMPATLCALLKAVYTHFPKPTQPDLDAGEKVVEREPSGEPVVPSAPDDV